MARIRTVKPEFWSSEQIMECSTNARLLFIGLWNFCDDYGRHPFSPKQIKALVFPGDNFTPDDVRGMLDELSTNDLIVVYNVEGKEFFQVTGWHHQKIDKRQDAKFPGPLDDRSTIIRRTVSTERNTEGKGEERIDRSNLRLDLPVPAKPARPPKADRNKISYPADFEEFWKAYPTDPNMPKPNALKAWNALSEDDRRAATASLPAFRQFCSKDPTYRPVYAERYLSQRRFEGHSAPTTAPAIDETPEAKAERWKLTFNEIVNGTVGGGNA